MAYENIKEEAHKHIENGKVKAKLARTIWGAVLEKQNSKAPFTVINKRLATFIDDTLRKEYGTQDWEMNDKHGKKTGKKASKFWVYYEVRNIVTYSYIIHIRIGQTSDDEMMLYFDDMAQLLQQLEVHIANEYGKAKQKTAEYLNKEKGLQALEKDAAKMVKSMGDIYAYDRTDILREVFYQAGIHFPKS